MIRLAPLLTLLAVGPAMAATPLTTASDITIGISADKKAFVGVEESVKGTVTRFKPVMLKAPKWKKKRLRGAPSYSVDIRDEETKAKSQAKADIKRKAVDEAMAKVGATQTDTISGSFTGRVRLLDFGVVILVDGDQVIARSGDASVMKNQRHQEEGVPHGRALQGHAGDQDSAGRRSERMESRGHPRRSHLHPRRRECRQGSPGAPAHRRGPVQDRPIRQLCSPARRAATAGNPQAAVYSTYMHDVVAAGALLAFLGAPVLASAGAPGQGLELRYRVAIEDARRRSNCYQSRSASDVAQPCSKRKYCRSRRREDATPTPPTAFSMGQRDAVTVRWCFGTS